MMKKLYSDTLFGVWKARAKKYLLSAGALMLASLIVCVFLCTRVRTGNADRMLFAVVGISAVTGWAVMLILFFCYAPAHAQERHICGILDNSEEEYTGEMHVLGEKIHIPKSIDVYKVALKDGEETKTFHVNAVFLRELPENGTRVRVVAVRKFITGYEVIA